MERQKITEKSGLIEMGKIDLDEFVKVAKLMVRLLARPMDALVRASEIPPRLQSLHKSGKA